MGRSDEAFASSQTALAACFWLCFSPATAEAAPESWYVYFGLGGSHSSYPAEVEKTLDLVGDASSEDVQLCLDVFGFYWPVPERPRSLTGCCGQWLCRQPGKRREIGPGRLLPHGVQLDAFFRA